MRIQRILCGAFCLIMATVCVAVAQTWLENFETGSKTSYTDGNVACTMGSWRMNDAMLGTSASDRKFGSQSARLREGFISMNFDKANGVETFSFYFAKFGTDANSTIVIEYSTDGGVNWTQTGDSISVNATTLTQAIRTLNIAGNVRFRISKTGADRRVSVDNIAITDYSGPPPFLAAPVALAAKDVTPQSFTATWAEVANAKGYLLDVWQVAITTIVSTATIFDESFNGFAAGSPNSFADGTDISTSLNTYTEEAGWRGDNVYQAGGTVKVGATSRLGWIMTPEMNLSGTAGAFEISMKACAWSGDQSEFKVFLINGTATNALGTVTNLNNDLNYTFLAKSMIGSGGTASSKLRFEGKQASRARFFLEDLVVRQEVSIDVPQTNFVCQGAAMTGLSTNLSGLTPGVYYYSVRAKDGVLISAASNVITVDTGSPLSSGIDLRAYQGADGVYVEFIAYDVEQDGGVTLYLLDADGNVAWSGMVAVEAGPQYVCRFLVPGLVQGETYSFVVRDEVGKVWRAPEVAVKPFAAEMISMSLAGITLAFDSLPDRDYEIQWTTRLGTAWQVVTNVPSQGERTSVVVAHPDPTSPTGFFRIRLK